MRSSTGSSVLIAIILTACADNVPTAVGNTPAAEARIAQASLTDSKFSGKCETAFAPPPFPLPPVIQQTDTGTCRVAHLGRTDFFALQEINFAAGTAVSTNVRFTAANGDILEATSAGTFAPSGTGVSIDGMFTFTGGTGRFANATGEARVEGQADFTTNTTTLSIVDGRISYSPSDRKK